MAIEEIITVDKEILGGTPVFTGTRVPVKNLFDCLRAGDSLNDFLDDFDYIPKAHCMVVLETAELLLVNRGSEKLQPSDFRGKLNLTNEQYKRFSKSP